MTDQEGGRPKIVINFTDALQTPKNPKDEYMEKTLADARDMALAKMDSSTSLANFMRYHYAAMVSVPKFSSWIFEQSPEIKAEEILEEFESQDRIRRFSKNEELATEMRSRLEQLPENSQMKIALARVRVNSNHEGWTYRVLAAFPKGEKAVDDVLVSDANDQTGKDYVFYQPETACVQHACDVLYKKNKQEGAERAIVVLSADYLTFEEAYEAASKHRGDSTSEFVLDTSLDGAVITQNPEKYIIAGIQNVFSNEWDRVRISDYWNKSDNN